MRPERFPQESVYHTLPGRACQAPTVQQKKDIRPFTSGCPFYCLKASLFTFFSKKVNQPVKIDYEYIINLIQNIVTPDEDAEAISPEERQKQIDEVKQYIDEMRKDNPKVAEIMTNLVSEIEEDENKYKGQSILNIVENMKRDCIEKVISDFCVTWYASKEDVMYAALHYRNGEIPNESVIKATIDYQSYKSVQEKALPKFKYYAKCMAELKKTLDEEIKPLISVA